MGGHSFDGDIDSNISAVMDNSDINIRTSYFTSLDINLPNNEVKHYTYDIGEMRNSAEDDAFEILMQQAYNDIKDRILLGDRCFEKWYPNAECIDVFEDDDMFWDAIDDNICGDVELQDISCSGTKIC